MEDYEALDIAQWCNEGPQRMPDGAKMPRGLVTLRGLPFLIGTDNNQEKCLLYFGPEGYRDPVAITLKRPAKWIIFAHRLLETHLLEGEPPGKEIAVYRFQGESGLIDERIIRERFEISALPVPWGQLPFAAVADQHDGVPPRFEGRWDQVGWRQTEAYGAYPRWFVLWGWKNPQPGALIEAVIVEPKERPFVIAALTVSFLDEDPLRSRPAVPVVFQFREKRRGDRLVLEVDRGKAGYVYPLPDESPEVFLQHPFKGWGQSYDPESSKAYAWVSAQPSATIRLKEGDQSLLIRRFADLNAAPTDDRETKEVVSVRVLDSGKNWVHTTVLDEETGKPVPCRIHFRSPEGVPYQPHGHHDHLLSDMGTWHIDVGGDLRLGHITYAYIDGTCQGWLPRGKVIVDVARGFEYEPLRTEVFIEPGQRTLVLKIRRWINMNERRWFSGDTHVHFLSTTGAHLEAQGEDLNVVNLLQSQWGGLFTNTEDFLGRPVPSPDGKTIVYTNQENRQHLLGHLILLGLKKPIMPWCTDGPGEAELGGSLEATMSWWADECKKQGGTVIIPHFPAPNGEPAALVVTARADAVEMLQHSLYQHIEYYRYLNGGYRLPLVGGTDKMTSDVPVGLYRTYVYIPTDEPFDYDHWCKNLRLGRTFISGGPLLHFQVEGALPGDTLRLPAGGGYVEAEAVAESVFPIHTLQIVEAGRVVAEVSSEKGCRRLQLREKIKVERHTWLAARVGGPGYTQVIPHFDGWRRGIMAHSSPIYIAVGEHWWMYSNETAQYIMTLLEGGLCYLREQSCLQEKGKATHVHGETDHLAWLERPFHEAIKKLKETMNRFGQRVNG
ncbi:MAG: CehA/McbA family metallohydrolase [Armatimonadetes bacterium]|nr:CehA/McbA family metallohydrolase [Armatimonadota bacterium]MDW8122635.1 CehA/McbA family metallohydrolase [Armatimonadota bacterium]